MKTGNLAPAIAAVTFSHINSLYSDIPASFSYCTTVVDMNTENLAPATAAVSISHNTVKPVWNDHPKC